MDKVYTFLNSPGFKEFVKLFDSFYNEHETLINSTCFELFEQDPEKIYQIYLIEDINDRFERFKSTFNFDSKEQFLNFLETLETFFNSFIEVFHCDSKRIFFYFLNALSNYDFLNLSSCQVEETVLYSKNIVRKTAQDNIPYSLLISIALICLLYENSDFILNSNNYEKLFEQYNSFWQLYKKNVKTF
jgi:hypothetical protein